MGKSIRYCRLSYIQSVEHTEDMNTHISYKLYISGKKFQGRKYVVMALVNVTSRINMVTLMYLYNKKILSCKLTDANVNHSCSILNCF